MGRGAESNTDCPRLRGAGLYELSWGNDRTPPGGPQGDCWHVATGDGEHVTWPEWQAITAAAVQSVGAMDSALTASPAGPAWSRAKAAWAARGLLPLAFLLQVRARYAPLDGLPPSPWNG
jgi:hypothetical protein